MLLVAPVNRFLARQSRPPPWSLADISGWEHIGCELYTNVRRLWIGWTAMLSISVSQTTNDRERPSRREMEVIAFSSALPLSARSQLQTSLD